MAIQEIIVTGNYLQFSVPFCKAVSHIAYISCYFFNLNLPQNADKASLSVFPLDFL